MIHSHGVSTEGHPGGGPCPQERSVRNLTDRGLLAPSEMTRIEGQLRVHLGL